MVQLAKTEKGVLAECEEIIERGLESFIEVGNALLRIRNEKLYREQFDTFELYCGLKWGVSDRHAHRMIDAAEVAGNLSHSKSTKKSDQLVSPSSESQVRPLAALPAPVQRKAWAKAVETSKNGKPTAREVTAAVEIIAPKSKDKGDSEAVCWRRGLLYRAAEAAAGAEFEDWSNFKVDTQIIAAVDRASASWDRLGGYLRKLQNRREMKTPATTAGVMA